MLNRVVLAGRLTKDVELHNTPTGVAVANFTLAIDRNFKNAQGERETDFIPCVAYRQTAEFASNYLAKGKLAGVDGRIQVRSYNGQDGQKRWVTEVIVEDVHLLSPKDAGQTQQQGQAQTQTPPPYGTAPGTHGYQAPPGYTPPPPGYSQQAGQNPPPPGYGQAPPPGYHQTPPGYSQPPVQQSFGHPTNVAPPPEWLGNPPQGANPQGNHPQYGQHPNLSDDVPF